MKVVFDIEANGLVNPTKVWLIVCKELETGKLHVFRNLTDEPEEVARFKQFVSNVTVWIGHNVLGYDLPVLRSFGYLDVRPEAVTDTLIISKMVDYPRDGHSIEDYGLEFGFEKIKFSEFSKYSKEMEEYCIRDVEITERVYKKYERYITHPERQRAIRTEHSFQLVVNQLHDNGFAFNEDKARSLLAKVEQELAGLDSSILSAFPPREVLIREFTPKLTKFGTISRTSVPRSLHDNLSEYEAGKTYKHTRLEPFNPSSHKQLIDVLHDAGWQPEEKTTTHIQLERELNRLKFNNKRTEALDSELKVKYDKFSGLQKYGWKISETNLNTLPEDAPSPARLLAKRILLESRRRTLTEWLGLARDNRIHGKFYGIGAWTHRMAHQNPNTANIPTDAKLYGHEMRALWRAPARRLLVGVDAESIQLRIFAHYINDAEFIEALVKGKKDDKTDPHSLNQRVLGAKTRAHAKRFIFAYLLGAGPGKLAQILEVSREEGEAALERLVDRYSGLATLKQSVIPTDARRGWFTGLDGRAVRIPGETFGSRKHLAMSGYLQNGEAVVMKMACLKWYAQLDTIRDEFPRLKWMLVNFVHDEWQTEVNNDMDLAKRVAEIQANALKEVGEELKLNCPLAGSYWNDDLKDYTIGTNWSQTH